MTTIVDYGAGNLRSVRNTLEAIGAGYEVVNRPGDVERASRIILPGVGHFGQMMRSLDELGLRQPLRERVESGIPFLGICVGLQCLFERSEESPGSLGLGILPGVVRKFTGDVRVPHMGWNSLELRRPSRLLQGLGDNPFTYFAHSYFAPLISATAAACTYVEPYSAVIEQGNIYAVNIHPEKSGEAGLKVLYTLLDV